MNEQIEIADVPKWHDAHTAREWIMSNNIKPCSDCSGIGCVIDTITVYNVIDGFGIEEATFICTSCGGGGWVCLSCYAGDDKCECGR